MAMEYLGLSDINGPLVALDGVSGVGFEEMVRIQTAAGPRAGRVVALEGERAVVQVFAGTSGMDLSHASTRFSGHPMRLALADEIVGRIFNGAGEPVDGLGPVYADHYADINGSAINPVSRAYPRNYIRNIKKYLLAALYNAPVTMDSYYTSLVSHDLYGSGDRR